MVARAAIDQAFEDFAHRRMGETSPVGAKGLPQFTSYTPRTERPETGLGLAVEGRAPPCIGRHPETCNEKRRECYKANSLFDGRINVLTPNVIEAAVTPREAGATRVECALVFYSLHDAPWVFG